MSTDAETALVRLGRWTARVRAVAEPARLLLMIHGWGGDEDSMWVFAHGLPADFWVIAPRGLYRAEPDGYAWWPRDQQGRDVAGLDHLAQAAEQIVALIDEHAPAQLRTPARFSVIGFSQGAAIATGLALMKPDRVDRVAMLAGHIPGALKEALARTRLDGTSFFVAHGTEDELVEVSRAREAVRLLEAAGARVTVCEDAVGHKVSAPCLRGVQKFLRA